MGDDNEIRQVVRRQSEQFLDEARKATKDVAQIYDLETEFKKAKKNKSWMVYIVTAATIALLGGAAFITTSIIKQQTAALPVDINAFQSLNLRDVLDRAKRDEADLEAAKLDLSRLQSDEQSSLASAENDRLAALDSIKARGLSSDDEAKAIAEQEANSSSAKATIRSKFSDSVKKKQEAVNTLQTKVDSYNQRLTEQNRQQQEKLNNQNKLFELEKERLVTSYEAKIEDMKAAVLREEAAMKRQREDLQSSLTARWNPTYDDAKTTDLLGGFKLGKGGVVGTFAPNLNATGVLTTSDAEAIENSRANLLYLSAKLRAVPYLNSVPPALARMEYEARLQFDSYRAALIRASGIIDQRDKRIAELEERVRVDEAYLERYRWATSQYILENREGGYILDTRNVNELFVAMNPALPMMDGATGYVIRPGDKAIATISFFLKDGQIRAKLVQLNPGERLKPFDPIIVMVAAPISSTLSPSSDELSSLDAASRGQDQ